MKRSSLALGLGLLACSGAEDEARGRPSDGAAGARSAPLAQLLSSSPALGAEGVYPAPLWAGKGEEVVVSLVFSEPMTLAAELSLEARDHVRAISELEWSEDGTRLTLFIRPDFSAPRPLEDETQYRLDLSPVVGESGALLAPDVRLSNRGLTFTTGRYDPLLNHSCGHTFFGPFDSVVSSAVADESAPNISSTHVQYSVSLPEHAGGYGGWVRARFPTQGPYRLYFDSDLPLLSRDSVREFSLEHTPAACPGIGSEVTFTTDAGEDLYLFLGPVESPMRQVIVELVPQP